MAMLYPAWVIKFECSRKNGFRREILTLDNFPPIRSKRFKLTVIEMVIK